MSKGPASVDQFRSQLRRAGYYAEAHAHSEPTHHVGTCDEACRHGGRLHLHKIPYDIHGNRIPARRRTGVTVE